MATEAWTYGGIRLLNGKRVHGWTDPSGQELLYKDTGNHVIGGLYTVEVTRTEDRTTRSAPVFTGKITDDEELRKRLWTEDYAVKAKLEAKRKESSALNTSELDEALAPLLEIARHFRTQTERDLFAATVMRRIINSW